MTEQTKVGGEALERASKLLEQAEYQQVKKMLERAHEAKEAGLDPVEPRELRDTPDRDKTLEEWDHERANAEASQRPLSEAEFQELGKGIEDMAQADHDAAAAVAYDAGKVPRDYHEPPLQDPQLRKAYLDGHEKSLDQYATAARQLEQEQRERDPEKAGAAIAVRKSAEYEARMAQFAREAEDLPEAERQAFMEARGLEAAEPGTRVDVAANLQQTDDARHLELSEAAKAQYDRYGSGEIEFKDLQSTEDLAEGYEINRKIAHARMQQARLEKGEITAQELDDDTDAAEGRRLDDSIERGRQQRIEQDADKGEMEADRSQEAKAGNSLEDFDALAATQARHEVPEDVEAKFPGRGAGKARTHYYGKDMDRVAFVDKGDKMQSPRDFDQQGVRAMVDIANARGWDNVKVRGSESFRRSVYLEAAKRGIDVKGYEPTEAEKTVAEKSKANDQRNKDMAKSFHEADTPTEKSEAAKTYGRELRKAYAIEASLRAWQKKAGVSEQTAEKMQRTFHKAIEADLRAGRQLTNVKMYERKAERKPAEAEAEAEQVR